MECLNAVLSRLDRTEVLAVMESHMPKFIFLLRVAAHVLLRAG